MDQYYFRSDYQSSNAGHAPLRDCHPQSIPTHFHGGHAASSLAITSDPSPMALQPPGRDQTVPWSEQQTKAQSSSQRSIEVNPCWDPVPQSHRANSPQHASYPRGVHQPQPNVTTAQHRGASAQQPAPQSRRNSRHGRPLGGPMATAPFLKDFSLVAEAAKRAQMAVVMRDLESVTL